MVTEFDIRREMSRIEAIAISPLRRARMLLRLARRVKDGALKLIRLSYSLMQDCLGEEASRMRNAAMRLSHLHDEIRDLARTALADPTRPMSFAYASREQAYPRWMKELAAELGPA